MRTTTTAATICLAALAFPPPAASQVQRPPEAEVIRLLTSDVYEEWMDGLTWSGGVPPDERSPALLTAMIAALEQQTEWDRTRTGPSDPSFYHLGEAYLDGPPEHYRSREYGTASILDAIGLASVLRTPELLDGLKAIAAKSPGEIEEVTRIFGAEIRQCALDHLDGVEEENIFCDPTFWARQAQAPPS